MVCSIVRCEVQHSHFNNSVKATEWWKIGPEVLLDEAVLKNFKGQVPRYLRERLRRKVAKTVAKKQFGLGGTTKVKNQWSSAESSGAVVKKSVGIIRKGLLQVNRRRKSAAPSPDKMISNRHFAFNALLNVKLAELHQPHRNGEYVGWKRDMAKEFKELTSAEQQD